MDLHRIRTSLLVRALAPLAAAALALGACSPAPAATIPPDATGSTAPAVTATPVATVAPTPDTGFPVTLTDDESNVVTLAEVPTTIVSLTPASTEILFAIGLGDRVVATTDFDDYPPEAIALPDVASYTSVDVEKIVGLGADLVVAGGNYFNDPEALAKLRDLGVPVLVTYAPSVAGVLHDIELIGQATGAVEAATELAATMRARFTELADLTAGAATKPRVFYELDATAAIYTAADQSFIQEMLQLAGADPITTGSTTSYEISLETLVAADPEVILLGDAAYGVTPDQVASRPGWGGMTAVTNTAIYPVDDIVVTRPGPRLVLGLEALITALHPELALPPAR